MLALGTNNLHPGRSAKPSDVAEALSAIVSLIRRRLPKAHIVVMHIFPRGRPSGSTPRDLIPEIGTVNKALGLLANDDGPHKIRVVDCSDQFVDGEGRIVEELMPDFLHPSLKGHGEWAECLRPHLLPLWEACRQSPAHCRDPKVSGALKIAAAAKKRGEASSQVERPQLDAAARHVHPGPHTHVHRKRKHAHHGAMASDPATAAASAVKVAAAA